MAEKGGSIPGAFLLRIAKYSGDYIRSAGILPAVPGASRSRPTRGQDAYATAGEAPTKSVRRYVQLGRAETHPSLRSPLSVDRIPADDALISHQPHLAMKIESCSVLGGTQANLPAQGR